MGLIKKLWWVEWKGIYFWMCMKLTQKRNKLIYSIPKFMQLFFLFLLSKALVDPADLSNLVANRMKYLSLQIWRVQTSWQYPVILTRSSFGHCWTFVLQLSLNHLCERKHKEMEPLAFSSTETPSGGCFCRMTVVSRMLKGIFAPILIVTTLRAEWGF